MDYSDIYLIPRYSTLQSRKQASTTCELGGYEFNLPIVPSNMPAIISPELAIQLGKLGYFYILHRFLPYSDVKNFLHKCKSESVITSISLGVKEKDFLFVDSLATEGIIPNFITIDVAHGHSILVQNMLGHIKNRLKNSFIIVGNVGTVLAVSNLEAWGADAIKVGIGGGRVCTTYNKTGFRTPMVETVFNCSKHSNVPIIADGGIRENGDIAKALVLGATMVMSGELFAGHIESPGKIVHINGLDHKYYFGNASILNGNRKNIEGTDIQVPLKGSVFDTLAYMQEDLQSAISYAGGDSLKIFPSVTWKVGTNREL